MNHIHFIGICGKGMGALAVLLKESGYTVTGSDEGFYDPMASYLKKNGITFMHPYHASNIPNDVDTIIIGKHARLTVGENEEVRAAFASGKPITTFPEMLGKLDSEKENTVVVGSYGKSTCTALMSFVLMHAGKDPSYFIGATPLDFETMSHAGNGPDFVLEGDEYPTSNTDGASKFMYLNATHILLTSAEHDHLNIFPTQESYLEPYKALLNSLQSDSILVASLGSPQVQALIQNRKNVHTYGLTNEADWYAKDIAFGEMSTFTLCKGDKEIISIETPLLGKHNIENIVGVGAMLLERNKVTREELREAVRLFNGVQGRLDNKHAKSKVLLFEGYGSSYDKTRPLFEALALHFPDRNIITVFEPHTFSWRNKNTLNWYDSVFDGSKEILILEPPTHGAQSHEQATLEQIVARTKEHFPHTYGFHDGQQALVKIKELVSEKDIVLMITSGDLLGIREKMQILLEELFPIS